MTSYPEIVVPIAIEPQALREHSTNRDLATHLGMEEVLQECGILALEGDEGAALIEAIKDLDEDLRELWNKLIRSLDSLNRLDRSLLPSSVAGLLDRPNLPSALEEKHFVVVAGEESAASHGLDYRTLFRTVGPLDVVMAPALKRAPLVAGALALRSFPPQTPRETIARSLLRPIARRSGVVTVFDPHLFAHVVGAGRGSRLNHVEWLAEVFAGELPEGATLRLVGNVPERKPPAEPLEASWIQSTIQSAISNAAGSRLPELKVEVCLFQGTMAKVKGHNRYLDFDCGFTFEVTADFARLGSPTNPGPDALSFHRLDKAQTRYARDVISGYLRYPHVKALVQWRFSSP